MGCIVSKRAVNASIPDIKQTHIQISPPPPETSVNIYIITDNIHKYYEFKQNLGSGHFGIVKLGVSKLGNKQKVAIKSVLKERVKEELQNLQRELTILKTVDHPNIIKLYEVFEDDKYIHIVMECCSGGELYDRLEKKGKYSEKEAAFLMYKLFYSINHLHVSNIAHRDLKPENCLFDTKRDDAEVKLVDFGLASKFTKDKGMSTVVGTPYYVAPEIINGNYGPECDIWSLGVILHTLLVGYPPFRGENKAEIFKKVLKAKYSLKEKEFETVSKEAKELIKKLLNPDSKKRITAAEAMEDIWFRNTISTTIDRPLDPIVVARLHSFKAESKIKGEIMKMLVQMLSDNDIFHLKDVFRKMDRSHSGFISPRDLELSFVEAGLDATKNRIQDVIREADFDKNGLLSYTEFLAATLELGTIMKQENVWAAFKKFDIENQGFISKAQLKKALEKTGIEITDTDVDTMMRELTLKNPSQIAFKEFCAILDRIKYTATQSYGIPEPLNTEEKKIGK
ncbi:hypothetical protein SteCoe_6407 [Stentor coeruleus]|uniref:non-specific serine/threonine protein kinase n=1 Tax=Stentor coeruleus TaxID=5963 RepID=A0A1R2CQ83_9CILI|nr:hypothetical protein SteCoe_6407 [Stentor coeruleus]